MGSFSLKLLRVGLLIGLSWRIYVSVPPLKGISGLSGRELTNELLEERRQRAAEQAALDEEHPCLHSEGEGNPPAPFFPGMGKGSFIK